MLIVVIVCRGLRGYSTGRLLVATFRNYSRILAQNVSRRDLMFSLVVLEQIWGNLALCVMMSTVWPLLFVTWLVYLGIGLVILLLLLLQNLLVSGEHSLDIIT